MDTSSLKIRIIMAPFSVFSLLQIAAAYLLKNMNADLEEHLESLIWVQEEVSAV